MKEYLMTRRSIWACAVMLALVGCSRVERIEAQGPGGLGLAVVLRASDPRLSLDPKSFDEKLKLTLDESRGPEFVMHGTAPSDGFLYVGATDKVSVRAYVEETQEGEVRESPFRT